MQTTGLRSTSKAPPIICRLDWDDIRALALESMDDHVIKMVYTAHAESMRKDNSLYRASAARLLRPRS